MTDITWPQSLPQQPELRGYRESGQGTTLVTRMDVGLPKTRRRYTAEVLALSLTYVLTGEQKESLEVFFRVSTDGGALRFNFPHPTKGGTVAARFVDRPSPEPLGAGYWKTSFTVDYLG